MRRVRRVFSRRQRRPVETTFRYLALGASAFVVVGLVYAAFSYSRIGGVMAAILLALLLAVIRMGGSGLE